MSLREHLYELRHRLALAVLFLVLGGVFGYIWWGWHIGGGPTLADLMLRPYCGLPEEARGGTPGGKCTLLATTPFEAFMVRMKMGLGVGAVITSPLWLYQIWAFIAPGLYVKERKFARRFVLFATGLFLAGAALAYFVVPQALKVLVSFGDGYFTTFFKADDYFSFLLVMLAIFGVSFELPLVIIMLNQVGVLTYDKLKRWRRGIFFALFVFGAFATPGTDPVSMIVLSVTMCVLFEVAVQVSRVHDRRKAARVAASGEDYSHLDDDEVSPLGTPEAEQPSAKPTSYDDVT
ncbi:twin-arginine translocase subunit TatC [Actinocrispum wychmicini]|nr:twin-arginine translocase subunit TatC [Actinocrispum wychmicini]